MDTAGGERPLPMQAAQKPLHRHAVLLSFPRMGPGHVPLGASLVEEPARIYGPKLVAHHGAGGSGIQRVGGVVQPCRAKPNRRVKSEAAAFRLGLGIGPRLAYERVRLSQFNRYLQPDRS